MSTDRVIDGQRLGGGVWARWRARRCGLATYTRLDDAPPERRNETRRAARLRWGKALDCADRFLCDCLVSNRTRDGARLRLLRDAGLPSRFQFFEDDTGALYAARVVWRSGKDVGCRLSAAPTVDAERVRRRMQGGYYAL